MIKVFVEVREGASPFRVAVRAESITHAISIIEVHHPGRNVRVIVPIDSDEFFTEGTQEIGAGQDASERPLHEPVMRV